LIAFVRLVCIVSPILARSRPVSRLLAALAILLSAAPAPAPAAAQEFVPLLDPARRDLLHEALSGEIAKDHVIQITRHHRIQGSRGYRGAAQYVLAQLRAYGFGEDEAWIESFPSDGRVAYQTWQSPSGWDVDWAELRMVEPADERIVGYPEVAMSLITYSNPGDVTAELVWVGAGTGEADYAGKDVRGKFVLATGYGGSVHRLAVLQHGAAGVVAYLDDDRARDYPDMLQYTGMWPTTDELPRVTFGFNLTNRQGERLRDLLARGRKVVLRGQVKGTGLESYFLDVVVARIAGSEKPAEEIVFSAHLDHPKESANDNASGSAALLDIARALNQLVAGGRLPPPKRSLRFLWVPEWYGTMAYLDQHEEFAGPALGGSWLANLNLDMVGEHLELLHSSLVLTRTPASIPSAANDVVANMAAMVDGMDIRTPRGSRSRFNYRVTPYSGGSDHMMFIDRKIPAMMFSHSPDYTHHTSEDTPDKVDPVQLERSELIAAATALYLSDLSEAEAADLAHLVAANSAGRLGTAVRDARRRMLTAEGAARPTARAEALSAVRLHAGWERDAVASVLGLGTGERLRGTVAALNAQLAAQADAARSVLDADGAGAGAAPAGAADRRVPERVTRGPLDFGLPESRLAADGAAWYGSAEFTLFGDARFELVNFVDGRRTVSEIRDALSAEFGPVALGVVTRYLEDLVKVGVMGWR
jgi:aminopeptidase YwaD